MTDILKGALLVDTQENQNFWDEAENELRKAGETTIVDFFKELLHNEYELEKFRHENELNNISQKLKYRLTIEGKKKVLMDEYETTIVYLEDELEGGEFRHFFGDLSEVTLDKVMDKVKSIFSLIKTSSIWNSMNHNEKKFFLSVINLPSNLIKPDLPHKDAYKIILAKLKIRVLNENDKNPKNLTLNKQLINFGNSLFYDHFQVELNKKLQEMLKEYVDPSEINLQSSNTSNITKWKKDKVEFYQLIYALHSANYIDGEVSKVVESLAPAFGIELSKSWQSGFTHNIQDNGKNYKPRIFEDIEKAYQSYIKRRFFDK